jgi:hypothetical protein
MHSMETSKRIIPVELADGTTIYLEATLLGEQQIALQGRPFREVTDTIKAVASELTDTLKVLQPNKATIKFGLEIGIQSGQITTLIVQGSSKGNIEITLEWES